MPYKMATPKNQKNLDGESLKGNKKGISPEMPKSNGAPKKTYAIIA